MSYIAVDFDGTVVTHDYPKVGTDIPDCVEVLRDLVSHGHQLIINTMRDGKELEDAVNWYKKHEIPVFGINHNPTQSEWTTSPKVYAQLYIDDAALGSPVTHNGILSKRPYVDWIKVRTYLVYHDFITE
jgi:hydroxymethylpyrimidine pyrophosphatase-like HAD family hydrolase